MFSLETVLLPFIGGCSLVGTVSPSLERLSENRPLCFSVYVLVEILLKSSKIESSAVN